MKNVIKTLFVAIVALAVTSAYAQGDGTVKKDAKKDKMEKKAPAKKKAKKEAKKDAPAK